MHESVSEFLPDPPGSTWVVGGAELQTHHLQKTGDEARV